MKPTMIEAEAAAQIALSAPVDIADHVARIKKHTSDVIGLCYAMRLGIAEAIRAEAGAVKFTPRESQVLGLIRAGKTKKEIQSELCLSTGTVNTYVNSLYKKTKAANRAELRAWAPNQKGKE